MLPVDAAIVGLEPPSARISDPVTPPSLVPGFWTGCLNVRMGPFPAATLIAVLVAISIVESPLVLLFNPMATASLIPFVVLGSDESGRQQERTDQNYGDC